MSYRWPQHVATTKLESTKTGKYIYYIDITFGTKLERDNCDVINMHFNPFISWSIIEIETSPEYPDEVQAYAAGLLEGSLTWQLIHHHWYNTVRAACAPRASLCRKMRRYLRENAASARENAALLRFEDPYWHMVSKNFSII